MDGFEDSQDSCPLVGRVVNSHQFAVAQPWWQTARLLGANAWYQATEFRLKLTKCLTQLFLPLKLSKTKSINQWLTE